MTRLDRLFPVEEIRRGLHGTGYTVFEQDRVEPFDVEILGVMEGMLGPGQDVILARLSGSRIEFTGVISGMSGSPVFIEGRLVGAVAYRFGSFSKEPIAGITPIQAMLDADQLVLPERKRPTWTDLPERTRSATGGPSSGRRVHPAAPPASPPGTGMHPVGPVWSWSGLSGPARAQLRARLHESGLVLPEAAQSAVGGTAGRVPAAPILPGAPIAAVLASGDLNIAAIGTVTFVDADRVLGFGHPFLGWGAVAFPLGTAAILNTLASEAGSYKQGRAAELVGSVDHDRLTAIAGRLGPSPPTVPVTVRLRDGRAPATDRVTRVRIIDDPVWLPALVEAAVFNTGARRTGFEAGGSMEVAVRLDLGDRGLDIRDSYAAPPPVPLAAAAANDVSSLVRTIVQNPFRRIRVEGVDVELRATAEVALAEVDTVTPETSRVRPGSTLNVAVELLPFRGSLHRITLAVPIPKQAEGTLDLVVGSGFALDRRDAQTRGQAEVRDVDALLGRLAERRSARGLYARVYLPEGGVTTDGEALPNLPPAKRLVLGGPSFRALEEAPGPSVSVPLDVTVDGSKEVKLWVVR